MKGEVEKSIVYKIELSKKEAEWLKNYMQNQLQDTEHIDDKVMRELFFTQLKKLFEL